MLEGSLVKILILGRWTQMKSLDLWQPTFSPHGHWVRWMPIRRPAQDARNQARGRWDPPPAFLATCVTVVYLAIWHSTVKVGVSLLSWIIHSKAVLVWWGIVAVSSSTVSHLASVMWSRCNMFFASTFTNSVLIGKKIQSLCKNRTVVLPSTVLEPEVVQASQMSDPP